MAESFQARKRIRLYQTTPISFPNINNTSSSSNSFNNTNHEQNIEFDKKINSIQNELKIMDNKINYIGTTTNSIVNKINKLDNNQLIIIDGISKLDKKIDELQDIIKILCTKLNFDSVNLSKESIIPPEMLNAYG